MSYSANLTQAELITARIECIKKVLTTLEFSDIPYVILRNYGFLIQPKNEILPSERSIDMVISEKDLPTFEIVMQELHFMKRNFRYSHSHHAYFQILHTEPISFDVQVGGVFWNDMLYLEAEEVFKNKLKKSFFYVLSPNDQYVMLITHSILGKRYFKEEYQKELLSLITHIDRNTVLSRLSEIFSPKVALHISSLVLSGQFKEIIRKKYKYIFSFLFKSSERVKSFSLYFYHWAKWESIRWYPLISIIGPDGAGKTTAANALCVYLKKYNRKAVVVYTGRGRAHFLPLGRVGRFYKKKEKANDAFQRNGAKEHLTDKVSCQRKILYTAFAPVYAIDLWLRYLFKILPKRLSHQIIITDRYCSDILLMEHVPFWLKKLFFNLFPKPTITFYLYNEAKILYDRRQEESIEELQRQMEIFSKFNKDLHSIEIKTDNQEKNEEEIMSKVMSHVYKEWV